jgi:hypothetical protein
VGTKDLLNPEWEPVDAARFIRDVRVTTTSLGTVNGHASASGGFPADVDFLNREISAFFDLVTARGEKLCWDRCEGAPQASTKSYRDQSSSDAALTCSYIRRIENEREHQRILIAAPTTARPEVSGGHHESHVA